MQSSELLPEWLRAHTVKQRPNHKHDKHPPPPRPSPPPPLKVRMEPEAVVYSRNKVVTGFDDCSAILMQRLPLISSDQLHVTGSAATACKMAPRGMWRVPSLLHEADLILAHLSLRICNSDPVSLSRLFPPHATPPQYVLSFSSRKDFRSFFPHPSSTRIEFIIP